MTNVQGEVSSKARTGKSIQVNGEWYGVFDASSLDHVNRGDTVTFNAKKSKCGRFNNISGTVSVGSNGASAPSGGSSPTPARSYGGGGRTFPVGALAPERTINRQNALTNAIAYHKDADVDTNIIINTARIFEAYTTGDLDQQEAEEAMAVLGG